MAARTRTAMVSGTRMATRSLASFAEGGAPAPSTYPENKAATIINICPQGRHHVVQRFGKFNRVETGGLFFTIPVIDSIIEHDMREMTLPILPQVAVTKDNVYVELSGVLFVQITDAERASYGVRRPLYSVIKAAEAAMRNAIGELDLDESFREKDKLNRNVMSALAEATVPWGLKVMRYEVTDIEVGHEIKQAMNLQAAAERQRREAELGADADASVTRKLAAAQRQKDADESLGVKARLENEAAGEAAATRMRAEAERDAAVAEAEGLAEANSVLAKSLADGPKAEEALRYTLATQYVDALGRVAGANNSNTLFLNQDLGNVTSVLAKGYAMLDALGGEGVLSKERGGAGGGGGGGGGGAGGLTAGGNAAARDFSTTAQQLAHGAAGAEGADCDLGWPEGFMPPPPKN